MGNLILIIVLLLLAIAGVVVRKTYYYLPVTELKRRAEKHDALASKIYPAVAYGSSLRSLLWLYIALASAASFVVLARHVPIWLSLVVVGVLLWIAFSWLPFSRVTKPGTRLTIMVTPVIMWLLNYLHPVLSRSTDNVQKHLSTTQHTGLFERDDVITLIEQQQWQADNRLSEEELEIIKRALSFDERYVGAILTSRKHVKTVLADDTIGPILFDELHKSGQGSVLVKDKPKGQIVGTLEVEHLALRTTGRVRDVMSDKVYYLHENDNLSEALHAFFVTNHPVFIVTNSFEEFVGVVTVEQILHELLGHVPGDDFDQYADISAVAARHPKHHDTSHEARDKKNGQATDNSDVDDDGVSS